MQFQGSFSIAKGDHIRFNRYMSYKNILRACLVGVFLGALAFFSLRFKAAPSWKPLLALSIAVGLGTGALVYGARMLWIIFRVNQFYRAGKLRDISLHITLDKRGIHTIADGKTADTAWKYLLLASETGEGFYLFLTPAYANVLPKKQIAANDMLLIRQILNQYVAPEKRKLKK